ncbi:hypothetical protein HC028_00620 [Planosporangium flavigriseum]|uniref:Uncharacterized protein n=1 Tax=Planosporangium flavigriseum TaxID=373681 RepID=A0A8J3LGV8_9ACTN|nr:hypothetical protein [Planosporangium flavigriseum]NJC63025.1 hypothetical protein [Planosporangium flavigriseum]GIG73103.1 hypothetical protein Pfl04_15070 [Planosporangium flavigriseum]
MFESLPPSAAGDNVGPAGIPAEHAALARRLREAEDRLFPLAMVDADRYQRAVLLVGLLARRLSETCASLDELAAGADGLTGWLVAAAGAEGVPLDGLDTALVVEAAMSQRLRGLLQEQADELRRQAVERARAAGLTWAVIEEPSPAAWRTGSARWVEAHIETDALMVRSVVADPRTGLPAYRLEVFGVAGDDPSQGVRVEEFTDRDAWLAAADEVRSSFASES